MSETREGKTVAASDFLPTFGNIFKLCSIDPSNGCCHHEKVAVIYDRMGIADLVFIAANVLFDLFESLGVVFPAACGVVYVRQKPRNKKVHHPVDLLNVIEKLYFRIIDKESSMPQMYD